MILQRIRNLIARGIFQLADDSKNVQTIQHTLLANEVRSNVERPQQYGFTSHPLPGMPTITVCHGGQRDNASVICVYDHKHRPKGMQAGEVAIYTHEGTKISLLNGNRIVIEAAQSAQIAAQSVQIDANTGVTITAPVVTINGNLQVNGTINATGKIKSDTDLEDSFGTLANNRTKYNQHTHTESGGGTTSTPTPTQP